MDKTEKRIALYCALFIAIILNSNRLLALRENGIMAQYWHFNLYEFLFQIIYAFGFCYLFIRLNLKPGLWTKRSILAYILNGLKYFAFLIVGMLIGGVVQRRLISDMSQLKGVFWGGYLSRFMATGLLAGIVVKIILLIREGQQKSKENEQLKSAYLEAELELLKGQLNPHFLFNSLSSLSGIIRENAQLAQHYVSQLSKVFRYSLQQSGANLVTVGDEIAMIASYGELLTMRLEKGFKMEINIDQPFLQAKIPHLSLQLLLENAAKHNIATIKKPLKVNVFISGGYLTVRNNLQEIPTPESSTGIGLANLNERYKILMGKEIEIIKSDEYFTVKLPLAL
jgi:two-component system LytT family sensor kinase